MSLWSTKCSPTVTGNTYALTQCADTLRHEGEYLSCEAGVLAFCGFPARAASPIISSWCQARSFKHTELL